MSPSPFGAEIDSLLLAKGCPALLGRRDKACYQGVGSDPTLNTAALVSCKQPERASDMFPYLQTRHGKNSASFSPDI